MAGEKKIRQSQVLYPYGVGAIVDYEGQSFITCDINYWQHCHVIHEERLESYLHVSEFQTPPIAEDNKPRVGIPVYRFPRWLFCANCRKMHLFRESEERGDHPRCKYCSHILTPMRFVVACEKGHLSDVPWDWWAHRNNARCECRDEIEFKTKEGNVDGTLSSLIIHCRKCGARNDLSQLTNMNFKCSGTHPWRRDDDAVECNTKTKVLQRGASNLRYDYSVEAISIPPWSDFEYWGSDAVRIRSHQDFMTMVRKIMTPVFDILVDEIANELGLDPLLVEQVAKSERNNADGFKRREPESGLEWEEYRALTAGDRKQHVLDKFQKHVVDTKSAVKTLKASPEQKDIYLILNRILRSVVVVDRLRCVRTLTGFSRISRDSNNIVPVHLGKGGKSWLPAIEYYGEGVFLDFECETLNAWADHEGVKKRADLILDRFGKLPAGVQRSYWSSDSFIPDAGFTLLHTIAHVLMLRMQYYAGYSASSIRERIYYSTKANEQMSGILLFTSAGDVEGSMGGLSRLGEVQSLYPLLVQAISDAMNCSYDPICIESKSQGMDGLNMSACHACSLVPETSCQFRNSFLDRALLVGTVDSPGLGYLRNIIDIIERI